jgi:ribosomal protein L11 methylase PrmA
VNLVTRGYRRRAVRLGGELAFDLRHRVDTRGLVKGVGDEHSNPYLGVDAREFHAAMADVPHDGRAFVDLGCGKGKAVLLACGYGFERAIGVEIDPHLTEVARRNLGSYRGRRRCPAEFVTADASTWEFPDEPLTVYVYNPFDAEVLARVLDNLARSLERSPRPATILYHTPFQRQVTDEYPALTLVTERPRWLVYEA